MTDWKPLCSVTLRWAATKLLEAAEYDSEIHDFAKKVNSIYAKEWNRLEKKRGKGPRRCFYYGTWPGSGGGHYFFKQNGRSSYHEGKKAQPFGFPDGNYQPDNGQVQGPAALRYRDGWTILAWWDRTEDSRPGCCSALMFEGVLGFRSMVELLEEWFPGVFARRMLTNYEGETVMESKGEW